MQRKSKTLEGVDYVLTNDRVLTINKDEDFITVSEKMIPFVINNAVPEMKEDVLKLLEDSKCKCKWCGKKFFKASINQKYCSDECRVEFKNYERRAKRKDEKEKAKIAAQKKKLAQEESMYYKMTPKERSDFNKEKELILQREEFDTYFQDALQEIKNGKN